MPIEKVFTEIFNSKRWLFDTSISGPGSEIEFMSHVLENIRLLFKQLKVKTLLDIPCGDFNWMQHMNLSGVEYLGADIVEELIEKNKKHFQNDNIRFKRMDITTEQLPMYDLILIKDCFVHFSYEHIFNSLKTIKESGSTYLMMTTFQNQSLNRDIITGQWRPLNMVKKPFSLPEPFYLIHEYVLPGFERENKGKSLGVWEIEDIPNYR